MSTENHDRADAIVAFASGTIIGIAAVLVYFRLQARCRPHARPMVSDNSYDGEDLFI